MLPDRVSNPGPLTYESGVLPIVLRGPASTLFLPVDLSILIIWMSPFVVSGVCGEIFHFFFFT